MIDTRSSISKRLTHVLRAIHFSIFDHVCAAAFDMFGRDRSGVAQLLFTTAETSARYVKMSLLLKSKMEDFHLYRGDLSSLKIFFVIYNWSLIIEYVCIDSKM